MQKSVSDEMLAQRVQSGDEAALGEIIERYTPRLARYGKRYLAAGDEIDDAVQDVFISVYENIRDFDAERRFSPWIYRIAHNTFVDVLRKKRTIPLPDIDLDRFLPHATYEDPDAKEKEGRELRVLLEGRLAELTSAYREILSLYYFEDFSYREIADILHIPIGTVGIRLSRARAALKKLLPPQDEL